MQNIKKNLEDLSSYTNITRCKFKCGFCMINLINKNDNLETSVASKYNVMRHWSIKFVEEQFKKLIKLELLQFG